MLVHSLMSEKYRKNTMLGGWVGNHPLWWVQTIGSSSAYKEEPNWNWGLNLKNEKHELEPDYLFIIEYYYCSLRGFLAPR